MRFLVSLLFMCFSFCLSAQNDIAESSGSKFVLKSNLLYWGTTTPNIGLEYRLANRWTIDLEAGLNPFDGKKDDGSYGKSIRHFRLHPEVRYWFCEAFHKHFIGFHVPYLAYNVSDIKFLGAKDARLQGWGTGVGVSYGYDWIIGKHWNIEATLGVGYLYLKSDRYSCLNCGMVQAKEKKHYVGPTQAALNLVYLF